MACSGFKPEAVAAWKRQMNSRSYGQPAKAFACHITSDINKKRPGLAHFLKKI